MPQTIQRSFTSGEIAPALRSRADLLKYSTGLALCQNFIVKAQGGVYTRPGTRHVGALADQSKKGRLVPFSFSTDQNYILVFENLRMRVVRDGGYVLAGGGPSVFQLTTPYTEDELPLLGFTQSADVLTIVHPDHPPANVSRVADDDWTIADIDYAPTVPPPDPVADVTVNITNAEQTDPVVIHAVNTFTEGATVQINGVQGMTELNGRAFTIISVTGITFELKGENGFSNNPYTSGGTATAGALTLVGEGAGDFDKTYTYSVTAVDVDGVESLPSAARSITTNSLSVTAGIRVAWQAVAGADYYRVYKDPSINTSTFGWIGDSKTAAFDDYNIAPITSDAPPQDNQPFADAGDRPGAVNYYQQRQVFARTNNEPQRVFGTQIANFKSFRKSTPSRDDDSLTYTIAGREVNEIRHIVALDALLLLTSGGEWRTTEGQDQVFVPATVGARIQSYNGASIVPPVIANDTVLYVQEKGARVRDLNYEFSSDKYRGNDLSVMAEHLFEGHTIVSMAFADEPYGILWCVRDDGVLLGLTYLKEHQVWGWHQHTTDGDYESVATISEDGRDAPYFIVKRTIDGNTVRHIERMEPRITGSSAAAFFVDDGLSYNGTPATVISGLEHLEGRQVVVLADGNEVEDLVVSGGQITLPNASSQVHVGLYYLPAIELLDMDISSPTDTLKGVEVSVGKVVIEVEDSRGGWVGPIADDGSSTLAEIKPRFEIDNYEDIQLRSYKQEIYLEPQWAKGGGIRIEQRTPLPLSILSVIPDVNVGG